MTEFPRQIIIETTAYCNQRCIHCAHKKFKSDKGNMEMSLFKKIIDELSVESPAAEVWMTFYGEALILKYELFYMINYAKNKGLTNVVLNSNAMLLNKEMSEMLIDSGLDRFVISMDGFSKESYEKIRVGGIYELVLNNALQFLSILKSRKINKPIFEMQFSILEENQHELEAFNKFWSSQGVYVKNRPKASWAGRVETKNLDPSRKRIPCKWALNHGTILWDGSLVACGIDCEGEFKAGNINESTIKELWDTVHKKFRKIHIGEEWQKLPDICKDCLDWQTTDRNYIVPKNEMGDDSYRENNLDIYKDNYNNNSKFFDENILILSSYSQKIVKAIKNRNVKSLISLGIGHSVVNKTIITELGQLLEKYLIIEGSSEIINKFETEIGIYSNVYLVNSLFEKFFTDEKFDAIEMGFMLEHVDDPLFVIKKFSKLLKPKGIIFIAVPNAKSLHRMIGKKAGILDNIYKLSEDDKKFGHRRYFDKELLIKLIHESNMKIINMEGIFLKPFSTSQLNSLQLTSETMDALFSIGTNYPEISNAIYAEVAL